MRDFIEKRRLVLGILCYMVMLALFQLLYQIVELIGVKSGFNFWGYILILSISSLLCLLSFKTLFFFLSDKLGGNKISLISVFVLVIFLLLSQYLSYKFGVEVGEEIDSINELDIPQSMKGEFFISLHLVLFLFYSWFFVSKPMKKEIK